MLQPKAFVHDKTTLGLVRFGNGCLCLMMEPISGHVSKGGRSGLSGPFPVKRSEIVPATEKDFEEFKVQSHPSWFIELSYDKCGALIHAVGTLMISRDLCSGAVLDGESDKDLVDLMMHDGLDGVEAEEMLLVPISQAINFNHLDV